MYSRLPFSPSPSDFYIHITCQIALLGHFRLSDADRSVLEYVVGILVRSDTRGGQTRLIRVGGSAALSALARHTIHSFGGEYITSWTRCAMCIILFCHDFRVWRQLLHAKVVLVMFAIYLVDI